MLTGEPEHNRTFSFEISEIFVWLPYLIFPTAILFVSFWYLWPQPVEFPMDDTYIHFVYARNLVENGKLMFNSPDEQGVGSSSLLWLGLLSGGYALGIPLHLMAKILGILGLVAVCVVIYELLSPILGMTYAVIGAMLIGLSGHLLWFSLSGMETTLFLVLGLSALLSYRQEKWVWLGLFSGLLILARPEGVLLAPALALVDLLVHRRIRRPLIIAGLITVLLSAPWFIYLWLRTGYALPTSAIGRHVSSSIALEVILQRNGILAHLVRFPMIVYLGLWGIYVIEFVLGGMALPAPRIAIGTVIGNPHYSISVWAILGLILIIFPVLWKVAGRALNWEQLKRWSLDRNRRPLLIFLVWTLFHNLAYMAFLPIPGTASRYGVVNHVLVWLTLTLGLTAFEDRTRRRQLLTAGLLALAVFNTLYWNDVYDANLEHMNRVRIAAAGYLQQRVPMEERCAAYDIGALRFYSDRPVTDLGGLIDPDLRTWYEANDLDRYLLQQGVTCLVIPGDHGSTDDGWFDFAELIGIPRSAYFEMQQLTVFRIDRERWLEGYLPTNNYQASVTIYDLTP